MDTNIAAAEEDRGEGFEWAEEVPPRTASLRSEGEPSEPDFLAILDRARQRDDAAWTILVGHYEPQIRELARALIGPGLRQEVDPSDLVQAVHWILWSGLRRGKYQLTQREELLALAATILRHAVARLWRRIERQRRLASQSGRTTCPEDAPEMTRTAELDPFHQAQVADQIEHLCKGLSAVERELIELRLQGHTTAEAARVLGRDPNSLRVTLRRIRLKVPRTTGATRPRTPAATR